MAQIHTGIKRVFIAFNIFFAVIGGIIIGLALLSQVLTNVHGHDIDGRTAGVITLYVFGAVTMVIAILGAFGAHKERKGALIAFLVCMVLGSLAMLRLGIPNAIARPQLDSVLDEKFHQLVPLDEASEDVKSMAEALQTELHCCGLFSYEDWRTNIPRSCDCDPEGESEAGECQTVTYNRLMQTKSIYSKACFPLLRWFILLVADVSLGVVFTLAVLAILGVLLSSIMIHQLRHPERPLLLLSIPSIFSPPPPPKYQELHNPPNY